MFIRLPFNYLVSIQLFRPSPVRVLEDCWVPDDDVNHALFTELQEKYKDDPDVFVKCQYIIGVNCDHIVVFQYQKGHLNKYRSEKK